MVTPSWLVGSMDDVDGIGISVYQDGDRIRLYSNGIERTLDIPAARRLITMLTTAVLDAAVWEVTREGGHHD